MSEKGRLFQCFERSYQIYIQLRQYRRNESVTIMGVNTVILVSAIILSLSRQSNCVGGISEVKDEEERQLLANNALQEIEKASNHMMARKIVEV